MVGEKFKLHTSDLNKIIDAAILYKEQAAKAGIDIELIREPQDGYRANVWLKKPWVSCFWNGRATQDLMFSTAYSAESKWNEVVDPIDWTVLRFSKLKSYWYYGVNMPNRP